MKPTLTSDQNILLLEVVRLRCPSLSDRMDSVDVRELNHEERRLLVGALGSEFAAAGVAEGSEPNQRGLQLEELIDVINRPNLKK